MPALAMPSCHGMEIFAPPLMGPTPAHRSAINVKLVSEVADVQVSHIPKQNQDICNATKSCEVQLTFTLSNYQVGLRVGAPASYSLYACCNHMQEGGCFGQGRFACILQLPARPPGPKDCFSGLRHVCDLVGRCALWC